MITAHSKYGALPFKDVIQPAIDIAEKNNLTTELYYANFNAGNVAIASGKFRESLDYYNKALQIVNGFDGVESYAIRTREKKVLLLGATELGASHAAFRFLDELGYRHFFPNSAWVGLLPRSCNRDLEN